MNATRPLGKPIVRMGEVTSTMDIARHLESLGAAEGTTVIASAQTHGRGRAGRAWTSPASTGFYCSILLRPKIPFDQFQSFSVAAGLAICDALDPDSRLGLQLKWPNDIVHGERKLAGLLITTSLMGSIVDSAILGIGLNLLQDSSRPRTAISLAELCGMQCDTEAPVVCLIARSLSERYADILEAKVVCATHGWKDRLAYLGQPVILDDGNSLHRGQLAGIDRNGSLLLDTKSGRFIITVGELTRGPRLA